MTFALESLPNLIAAWLWPFCRVAGLVALAPVFGYGGISARVKLVLALVLTLAVAPVAQVSTDIEPFSGEGMLVTASQVLIGLVLGFALRLVFVALEIAGQQIAMLMGLGFAALVDHQNGIDVPVLSNFYILLLTLTYLGLDGHLVAVQVLADSFTTLPVSTGIGANLLWAVSGQAGWVFSAAVLLAMPATIAMLTVNLGFGVMNRASPQMNVISIGFPVALLFGLVVMLITLPGIVDDFPSLIDRSLSLARLLAEGGP